MIRLHGKVLYDDGREVEFETGNAALAKWERYAARNGLAIGKDSPPILSSLVVAHHALGIAEPFDAWAEGVEGVELESTDVPPTPPAPSDG